MTCDEARSIIHGAYTHSVALAFGRHCMECQGCQKWLEDFTARFSPQVQAKAKEDFRRNQLPGLILASILDPEA
jgi:hypothetical protein